MSWKKKTCSPYLLSIKVSMSTLTPILSGYLEVKFRVSPKEIWRVCVPQPVRSLPHQTITCVLLLLLLQLMLMFFSTRWPNGAFMSCFMLENPPNFIQVLRVRHWLKLFIAQSQFLVLAMALPTSCLLFFSTRMGRGKPQWFDPLDPVWFPTIVCTQQ